MGAKGFSLSPSLSREGPTPPSLLCLPNGFLIHTLGGEGVSRTEEGSLLRALRRSHGGERAREGITI